MKDLFVLEPLRNEVPLVVPRSHGIGVLGVFGGVGEHVLAASPEDDLGREMRKVTIVTSWSCDRRNLKSTEREPDGDSPERRINSCYITR